MFCGPVVGRKGRVPVYARSKIIINKAHTSTKLIQQFTLCPLLIGLSIYCPFVPFKLLKRCHTVPSSSSLIFFCWVRERARVISDTKVTVYVLKLQFIHVLKFWVSERARVISHSKLTVYILNFEYAKPGTLRDRHNIDESEVTTDGTSKLIGSRPVTEYCSSTIPVRCN